MPYQADPDRGDQDRLTSVVVWAVLSAVPVPRLAWMVTSLLLLSS